MADPNEPVGLNWQHIYWLKNRIGARSGVLSGMAIRIEDKERNGNPFMTSSIEVGGESNGENLDTQTEAETDIPAFRLLLRDEASIETERKEDVS